MSYRFQKFTTLYPNFLRLFLAANPDHGDLSFAEYHERLVATRYGWSNFYEKHMRAIGNEAEEHFATVPSMQRAWAREHGLRFNKLHWVSDIVCAQVKNFKPDVIYLQDLYFFDEKFRRRLRDTAGKDVLLIGWRFSPTHDWSVFRDLDLILSGGPNFVKRLNEAGCNAYYLPMAFESSLLDEILPIDYDKSVDFSFIGSIGIGAGPHYQRYCDIERLLCNTPLQIWSESAPSHLRLTAYKGFAYLTRNLEILGLDPNQLEKIPGLKHGLRWSRNKTGIPLQHRFPKRFHQPVFGLDAYRLLASSRCVFNRHIDCTDDYAGNVRLYETTGMGACLVTDWKRNLPELFEPDSEVITYRSVEECKEKVTYLLEHESERESIARAGQQRTLRDHTYAERIPELHIVIQNLINNRRKQQRTIAI